MTTFKTHAAGPWTHDEQLGAIVDAEGNIVVKTTCFEGPHQAENILLVAHAPQMEAVLENAELALGMQDDEFNRVVTQNEALRDITHILNITQEVPDYFPSEFIYSRVSVADSLLVKISRTSPTRPISFRKA